MKNKEDRDKENEYGECICSYFEWLPISKQKRRTVELENMTKIKERKDKR